MPGAVESSSQVTSFQHFPALYSTPAAEGNQHPPCFLLVCSPSFLSSLLVYPCPGCPNPVWTSPEVAPVSVEEAGVLVDSLP